MSNPRNPAPVSKMTGSGFYLNSGRNVVMDEGFLTHVATLLEHNSFEEDSSDAFTATEYANEIYRVLFAQRGSPSPQTRAAPTPTEAPPVESQAALRAALNRQCDNMAFVINHMTVPAQYYEKFMRELEEDRDALAAEGSAE